MKKILILAMILVAGAAFAVTPATKAHKKNPHPVKKERATLKQFNENDPSTSADNTVTIIKEGQEMHVPIHKSWNESRVSPFRRRDVDLTFSYVPETGDYSVTNIEPFVN